MERLFVDTGAWFAYGNRGDPDHARVKKVLNSFAGRLVTTNFVVHETVTLCIFRRSHSDASRMGRVLFAAGVVDLVRVTAEDEQVAWSLFLDRSDKTYSFTDCTSFVVMHRLGITKAAAVDDDFSQEGFHVLPPVRKPRR
jgi:predicted nucleic acid-binding protein